MCRKSRRQPLEWARREDLGGDLARAAAIDGGDWTGAGSASVAGGVRPWTAPRIDRNPSAAPARDGWRFAALVSLAVHAAIVVAAGLRLGLPQPVGAPDAIVVELVASTGVAPAAPAPVAADNATSLPLDASPAAVRPAEASDALAPAPAAKPDPAVATAPEVDTIPPPQAAEAAEATDLAPSASPSPALTPDAARADVAPAPVAPPPLLASTPPEAGFSVAPRVEPRRSVRPPPRAARVLARPEPAARPSGVRATANAPAPAHGAAELAAYRNVLIAKISGLARYPEAARERGATGVATVRFALDGGGAVTLADLAQSSGDRALDDEAMAAVRRASPLPAPPAGAARAYSAPIRFELR